jgi:hypothetical protein
VRKRLGLEASLYQILQITLCALQAIDRNANFAEMPTN